MNGYADFQSPNRVRFGVDSFLTLSEEVQSFDAKRVVIVSDKGMVNTGLVDRTSRLLVDEGIHVDRFTDIEGEPSFQLLESAVTEVESYQPDVVIGLGGGSAMDTAKTIAALLGKEERSSYLSGEVTIPSRMVPCILLPTTAGTGAEVTMNAIFGDTKQGVKRGLVSSALLPDVAIVDPVLTRSCPPRVTASSGVDAFTHAIESYVAVRATPFTNMYAEKAMELFPLHIHQAVHNGSNLESRVGMSMVSHMAGISLANAGVGAVHALAYPLGGTYHVEHGVANALLLPFVLEVTGKTCTPQMVSVASKLQLGDYTETPDLALDAIIYYLLQLLEDLDLPSSLQELGVDEQSLPQLAKEASKVTRLLSNTPYTLNEKKILAIYERAYNGRGLRR
ncbi:alcohol dehydrogenase [Geomicrobium sp. JCM 19037]|uniref:iron-containing alcohol dehydrogenase n=1 Tax=Geomicrobium sp. JCM 19037 TaxID=1460634 RepID=UPI00045F255E|nr:iron-containing alcohol dehydrogenase [Geomicrobium sp. JCM 19037]GAK03889.1 alcohol dehydrogenase [Geomicrobium sp. JCM 19037]